MKKIFIILLLITAITNAKAQHHTYGSALGDTLMYLHSIANNNFKPLTGAAKVSGQVNDSKNKQQYDVPLLLGADMTTCADDNDGLGLKFQLKFIAHITDTNKGNRVNKIKDQALAFFNLLAKTKHYKVVQNDYNSVSLADGGHTILKYEYHNIKQPRPLKTLIIEVYK